MIPQKRRILEKIKISEISGVDRPAMPHAVVAIMKRVRDQIPAPPIAAPIEKQEPPPMTFEQTVSAIQRRDNCSGTEALSKARKEHPDAFETFRGIRPKKSTKKTDDDEDDFDELVEREKARGTPGAIAGQRVLQKYGATPDAARIQKSASATADFMAEVDTVMIAKRLTRTAAMSEVRRNHPDLFAKYQEV